MVQSNPKDTIFLTTFFTTCLGHVIRATSLSHDYITDITFIMNQSQ